MTAQRHAASIAPWPEVPMDLAVSDFTGGQTKMLGAEYRPTGRLPIVDQGQALIAGFTDDETAAYSGPLPVVLFGDHTRSLKYIDRRFALGADGVKVIAAKPGFLAKFIYFFWLSRPVRNLGYSRHFKLLREIPIPQPHPDEQARIVELLDQADALRRQRAEADAKLARLLPAIFRHHFGNTGRFTPTTLDQLGELDRGRSRHRPRNDPALYDGPYPFIQTGDVTASGGQITTYGQTYSEAGLAQSRLWKKGTLCITIAANIAETAILDFDACFPDSVVGFTPRPGVSTEFVQAFIDSIREEIAANAPQAAQKNINLEVLRQLEVPLPSPEEQTHFARQVAEIRNIRAHAATSAAKIETLFQTLLHRAFTGELTAKWREAHLSEGVQEMVNAARS